MPVADGVAAVELGSSGGKIEFRLVISVDSIERLASLDAIADLAEQPDAGALVDRRTGGSGQAVELQAVDFGNRAVVRGCDIEGQFADVGTADREALGVDNALHLLQCRAAVEQFAGARVAAAAA